MFLLNENDVIEFDYVNWEGKVGRRKAIVKYFAYGSNRYHKEPQTLLVGFDLDKLQTRMYAVKDMSNIDISDMHEDSNFMP